MPLIRITHAAGKTAAYRKAIADGVHQALVGSLNVPADDRFQIIAEQSDDSLIFDRNYLGIQRSADIVFIQVFLRRGRSTAMKQEFYRQVAQNLTTDPDWRRMIFSSRSAKTISMTGPSVRAARNMSNSHHVT
jgi:phenylpyruvate tautomerase PptA (4-oxalocrotonate tautomerase family)